MMTTPESAACWDMAKEEFIANPENLAAWIESARTDREPAVQFGMISNAELIGLIFSKPTSGERLTKWYAMDEFRKRFFAENAELIALEAQKLQEGIK